MTRERQRAIGVELDPLPHDRSVTGQCPFCGAWSSGSHRCEDDACDDDPVRETTAIERLRALIAGRKEGRRP